MILSRAARLHFAIHKPIGILAEHITAPVVTALAKQESARPQPTTAQRTDAPASQPRTRRLLRRAEIEERTRLPKTTIYDWMKRGQFPPPVRFGDATVAWLGSHI